ncbi:hypothetical protein, partial [Klebsiella pneumoniae]
NMMISYQELVRTFPNFATVPVISGVFILPQPWTVRGLRNRYCSHVSSFPERPSTLTIGPANDKFAHKAVSEILFDPSATYA